MASKISLLIRNLMLIFLAYEYFTGSSKEKRRERMSVKIRIDNALKKFGESTVIPDLSLEINKGEFFTLLGPSGCGKTTLLRMIAGFNSIEGGEFYFDDKKINDLDPAKRNIGMVFQNYAVFPHLTVRQNVEFGLKNKHFPKSEITRRAEKFLRIMQIDHLAERLPSSLSGGQQQRVALARALCIEPDVLLMDEPLSNLDAKLRVEMRTAIKNIQRSVGITTVYVTHDQEEAMAVSDRIAVMKSGVIEHIGTPKDIYQRPASLFVSTFIGRSNVLKGKLLMKNGSPHLELFNYSLAMHNIKEEYKKDMEITVCVRPEEFLIREDKADGIVAVVDDSIFLGMNTHYFMHLESGVQLECIRESGVENIISRGTKVALAVNDKKINLFTEGRSIMEGVLNDCSAARGGKK